MSGSLNKVMLIGNLGKDPETKHFEGGGMLVKFPIATSETYTNRAGEKVTQTEWHNVVITRKGLADICERYLKKGHKIYLEGRLKTRSWTDDTGNTRYMTEVSGDNMTILTSREEASSMQERQEGGSGYTPPSTAPAPSQKELDTNGFKIEEEDDDLPF